MRSGFLAFLFRLGAAIAAVLFLRALFGRMEPPPSLWLRAPVVFGAAKLAGDIVVLVLFRSSIVFFYEDMFWELLAFAILGLAAAGLITLALTFIGGAVEPYVLAVGVYFVYLVAERRQRHGAEGE